jgi:DNA-directed RNA polymerase subunit RPC12/RpoP
MWRCVKCEAEIEDKYLHCWQCGARHVQPPKPQAPVQQVAVPGFASYEQMAKVPRNGMWAFRRGRLQRIFFYALIFILFKVLGSPFLGAYGSYIVAVVGVVMLVLILWRSFRRDPTDGVGIKLH